jgi:hypothetical protein
MATQPSYGRATRGPQHPTTHLGPIESCPECNGRDFLIEEKRQGMVFQCLGCNRCWRYELGYVWPVAAT